MIGILIIGENWYNGGAVKEFCISLYRHKTLTAVTENRLKLSSLMDEPCSQYRKFDEILPPPKKKIAINPKS